MNILLVGGVERSMPHMRLACADTGHRLEHHGGASSPRANQALQSAIGRADLVVIVTGVNSHGAVLRARDLVRRRGIPSLICRSFGVAQLGRLLDALAARDRNQRLRPQLEAASLGTFLPATELS